MFSCSYLGRLLVSLRGGGVVNRAREENVEVCIAIGAMVRRNLDRRFDYGERGGGKVRSYTVLGQWGGNVRESRDVNGT